jgi:hypothetical protein
LPLSWNSFSRSHFSIWVIIILISNLQMLNIIFWPQFPQILSIPAHKHCGKDILPQITWLALPWSFPASHSGAPSPKKLSSNPAGTRCRAVFVRTQFFTYSATMDWMLHVEILSQLSVLGGRATGTWLDHEGRTLTDETGAIMKKAPELLCCSRRTQWDDPTLCDSTLILGFPAPRTKLLLFILIAFILITFCHHSPHGLR